MNKKTRKSVIQVVGHTNTLFCSSLPLVKKVNIILHLIELDRKESRAVHVSTGCYY